jgi:hypothetical protein
MRRADREPLLRFGIYPAARNPAAGEDERVVLVAVMNGELKIAVERRGGYRLPHKTFMRPWDGQQFDLDQGHKERNTRREKGVIGR